jgi:hypothetical protein
MAERCDHEFLVSYDYGGGGLWAVLIAPSAEAIRAEYPELYIVDEPPKWMSAERYEELRGCPLWLDQPPSGILTALIADRHR